MEDTGSRSMLGQIRRNLQATTSRPALTGYAKAALGGITYPLVPSLIETATKGAVDMTGWKGFLTGGAITVGIGMMAGWDDFVAGTVGALSAHLFYAKGNDLYHKATGRFLYRFDPTQAVTFSDGATGALQPGAVPYHLPDGSTVALYSAGATQQPRTMNDYVQPGQPLSDYVKPNQPLSDYVRPGAPLGDYVMKNQPLADLDLQREPGMDLM